MRSVLYLTLYDKVSELLLRLILLVPILITVARRSRSPLLAVCLSIVSHQHGTTGLLLQSFTLSLLSFPPSEWFSARANSSFQHLNTQCFLRELYARSVVAYAVASDASNAVEV